MADVEKKALSDEEQLKADLDVWEDIAEGQSLNVIIKPGSARLASLQRLLAHVRRSEGWDNS